METLEQIRQEITAFEIRDSCWCVKWAVNFRRCA